MVQGMRSLDWELLKEGAIIGMTDNDIENNIPLIDDKQKLHPQTKLGYVHLTISDMERSLFFYQQILGFQLQRQDGTTSHLGVGEKTLLALTEVSGAEYIPRRSGLYHYAILTPSRKALARSLKNLVDTETGLQGGADHLVSEALYLSDPDGNGIELYRDRPRSEWQYENGNIKMGTEPLDYRGILNEIEGVSETWHGLEPSTRLGHIHMHVADLEQAASFYENILGFDYLMDYMGSAAFLSVGGYHHHIGLNVWNGIGAPPPPLDSVGLRYFTIELVNGDDRKKLITRLSDRRIDFEATSEGLSVRDPSQNGILFV
jgi:catechol 2,3-dioxygenase